MKRKTGKKRDITSKTKQLNKNWGGPIKNWDKDKEKHTKKQQQIKTENSKT